MRFAMIILGYLLACLVAPYLAYASENLPIAVFLSWQGDPTTTMSVQWISNRETKAAKLAYRPLAKDDSWVTIKSKSIPFPDNAPYLLHRVELKNLSPQKAYALKFNNEEKAFKFRTLPDQLTKPFKFVVGGDIYHDSLKEIQEINTQAAKHSPYFAILGGDLTYATNEQENLSRWIDWLKLWQETMVTPEGFLIPMVATIGNHETIGRYDQNPSKAAVFNILFKTPNNRVYRTFDVGNYLAITLLNSGHTNEIAGMQSVWLGFVLKRRLHFAHRFAAYHVPAYPSVRNIDHKKSPLVRSHWVPLFERYHLQAAFEHHDHAYKRTVLIKNDRENNEGVLYLGDGAWGIAKPRAPKDCKDAWFLAKSAPIRHAIVVTLEEDKRTFEAIDQKGETIDSFSLESKHR